jgi:formyltetrahydrofolate deformylase
MNVNIPFIISNHPDLQWVGEKFGIPFHVIPLNKDNREELEKQEMKLLKDAKIDFIVLARYMQIISPDMIKNYPNNIINIHHSFLPHSLEQNPTMLLTNEG